LVDAGVGCVDGCATDSSYLHRGAAGLARSKSRTSGRPDGGDADRVRSGRCFWCTVSHCRAGGLCGARLC